MSLRLVFVPHVPASQWAFLPLCNKISFEPLRAAVLISTRHVVAAAPLTSRSPRGFWRVACGRLCLESAENTAGLRAGVGRGRCGQRR